MVNKFTDIARQVMVSANDAAQRNQQSFIGGLHLVIGVLDAAPEVRELLERESVDVGRLRETAARLQSSITSAGGTKRAIEEAMLAAERFQSPAVDAPHVLLGALLEPDGSVITLFQEANVRLDDVHAALIKFLTETSPLKDTI